MDYTSRLQALSLSPANLLFDKVLFYKIPHGLVHIHNFLLPTIRTSRKTRSSTINSTKYIIPDARRSAIKDSSLSDQLESDQLKLGTCGFSTFKTIVYNYYSISLQTCYNVDDPRSYKTICPKLV